jgi:hypothetical protein
MSVDAVLGETKVPQSWNRSAYARGNPLRYVDPDGRDERTGWQAGTVTNNSPVTILIAADMNGVTAVVALHPGESSQEFFEDTDAIVIAEGQTIDGEESGAIRIGTTDVEVAGNVSEDGSADLEIDAGNAEWLLNVALGKGGYQAKPDDPNWKPPVDKTAPEKNREAARADRQKKEQEKKKKKEGATKATKKKGDKK